MQLSSIDGDQALVADTRQLIDRLMSDIDQRVGRQLDEILHSPSFQRVEASWRSLQQLVESASGRTNIKVRVLDIKWSEINKDISRALEFDQSQLFQKIYSEEYDTPGGEPYGVIIADYEIRHRPDRKHRYDDMETMIGLAEIASAAFSPIIVNAAPELFGLDDSFDYLTRDGLLASLFDVNEYHAWNELRSHPDSRFIGVTLPRVLLRAPYRQESQHQLPFRYRETATTRSHFLWGGANFSVAGVLIREFSEVGWFAHIRGAPRDQLSGGMINHQPTDVFFLGDDGRDFKPQSDVVITDNRERELAGCGFISVCQCYDLPLLAVQSTPSLFKQRALTDAMSRANERVASSLQYVLCAARFAHYIKVMVRDKIGSYVRAEECSTMIQRWLRQYTVMQEDADWQLQSRHPLREARVKVSEHPEKPGEFFADIWLKPHYQADSLVSELQLRTELVGIKTH